jgi:L-ascorbate metabolism protein UlaG (beta-lactamase superfamily)
MTAWQRAAGRVSAACVLAFAQAGCGSPAERPTADAGLVVQQVDGRFRNPAGSPEATSTSGQAMAFWWWASFGASKEELNPPVPAGHALTPQQAQAQLAAQGAHDSLTWLGHAAFLIRLDGKNILIDPYLGDYASPINGLGPRRYAGPALTVDQLPPIDTLLISHNHYDHLDLRTLSRLPGKDTMQVIAPRRLGTLLRETGFSRVTEVSWGDSLASAGVRITSVPAIHFSSRGLFDRDETLWSGYVIESLHQRVYFAGDTAYHPTVFKRLRESFGPIDLALVPIGAYAPRALMAAVHVDPEEAAALARDMGARTAVAMHWGTVVLSQEPPFEPPRRFRAAGRTQGYGDEALWVMAIGESRSLSASAAPDRPLQLTTTLP